MEVVIRDLLKVLKSDPLLSIPEYSDTSAWPVGLKSKVQRFLSDWHLITFLCMHGPFSVEEQKLLCQAATAHHHPEHSNSLEQLFASNGWGTLLSLAEATAAEPSTDSFDRMGIDSPGTGGATTPAIDAGPKACPHCTYINEVGATDCDVCGLPLN